MFYKLLGPQDVRTDVSCYFPLKMARDRVNRLIFPYLEVPARLGVSFHPNPFPTPSVIYILGRHIVMHRTHVLMSAFSNCWHVLNVYVKNKSAAKQSLGKTLRIVLQPQATPSGTVRALLGTSAGYTRTDWGFVLGPSLSEFTVGLCLSTY